MNVNLEYYKIFYYVAKYGSLTKAAKDLCISQPAVSQGIKQLEDAIGVKVFVRKSKGVSLTAEGKMLFSYIKNGYEQILLGEQKLREMIGLDDGTIQIGASDMTLQYYLLPYLEKFHEMYPGIKINVTNAPTPRTIEHLLAGNIDFGVISSPFEAGDRFSVKTAKEIEDVFVAGKQYEDLKGKILEYDKLSEYPFICLEPNTSTRQYVDDYLESNGVVLNPEFELSTSAVVTQFAVRNLGIASVVYDFAKEEIANDRLFMLEFDKKIPKRNICVITDNKNPLSKAAKALFDILD